MANTTKKEIPNPPIFDTKCSQCGKKLGPEVLLSFVCGDCCRKNHAKVVGRSAK